MRIKCAAILHDGVVYEGRAHPEIGWEMLDKGVCEKPYPGGPYQGFVTDEGIFVDRRLARIIAIEAGQVDPEKACSPMHLYSEDLIHSELFDYPLKDKRYRRVSRP